MSKKGKMTNYIQTLKEENEKLKKEIKDKDQVVKKLKPYDDLPVNEDGRNDLVDIVYGPNSQNLKKETLPLHQAFDTLVRFYSGFSRPTDRNIPREYRDDYNQIQKCNNSPCLIKKRFKDIRSGQMIENLRKEVPLWLAVDNAVQQNHQVELITKKEFDDFYQEEVKKEIRRDRLFMEKKRQKLVEEVAKEENISLISKDKI
jgi:hypothetical protein